MLGLPGSCALVPYVPLYRLRQHQENCCDSGLVHPNEHLSRESQKLTVVIKRETGQPLDDLAESSGFLRINEGPVFPVMYVRGPYSDERGNTRGYIVAPLSNSYG